MTTDAAGPRVLKDFLRILAETTIVRDTSVRLLVVPEVRKDENVLLLSAALAGGERSEMTIHETNF